LWLDATYEPSLTKVGSAIYSVGEEVGAWADRTANGVSVTQSASIDKPLYEATNSSYQINGKPAVKYTTAPQYLASSAFNLGTAAADHSTPINVFSVGQLDLPTGSEFFLFDGANNSNEQFFGRWLQFPAGVYFQANTRNIAESDGAGVEANTTGILNPGSNPWMIHVENNRQGNSSFIRYNGTDVSPANCAFGEEGFDGLTVGSNYWTTKSLCGRIGEFLITSGTQTQADREKIEGYLAHKWGLTANLPAAHPYKTTAPFYES